MSFLDAKWEFVKFLCHLEGPAGSTTFRELKNNFSFSASGAPVISHAESRFGDGAGYFNGTSSLQTTFNVASTALGASNFCIEGSFYPVKLESLRVLIAQSTSYTSPTAYSDLGFVVEITADGRLRAHFGNSSGIRTIESPAGSVVVDEWHDFSISRHGGTIEMVINEVLVASIDVTGIVFYTSINAQIRCGASGPLYFYGYANNFRITVGDARAAETLLPVTTTFPAGNSVDTHREKVVFHCSFDTEDQSTEFVDHCGLSMVSSGAAKISRAASRYGATCGELLAGYVAAGPAAQLQLGAADFEIEWFEQRATNTTNAEYSFAFSNADGTDHGLSLRSIYGTAGITLRINGEDVATFSGASGSNNSISYFSLVRSGGMIALFKNGVAGGSYSIGSTVISSDGRLYLGKGPISAPPGSAGAVRLDEMRLTAGLARNNPLASTIPVPVDPFPRFGPRALSGSVMDENGLPLVRTVRCYRRADGRLVSETTSGADGAFVLPAADLGQHYVVVVDDVKNALIYDRVVPVLA